MAGDGTTYSPSEVSLIFGGYIIEGFADGSFIEVTHSKESFKLQPGRDAATRTATRDFSGSIKFTLKLQSPSNGVLSGILIADEQTYSGILPAQVKDGLGNELHLGAHSWLRGWPAAAFNMEQPTREWTIDVKNLSSFVGGHDHA